MATNTSWKLRPAARTWISTSPAPGARRRVPRSPRRSSTPARGMSARNGTVWSTLVASAVGAAGASSVACRSRGAQRSPSRNASRSSPGLGDVTTSASRDALSPAESASSRSTSTAWNSGCSARSDGTTPHSGAWPGWTRAWSGVTAMALRVTTQVRIDPGSAPAWRWSAWARRTSRSPPALGCVTWVLSSVQWDTARSSRPVRSSAAINRVSASEASHRAAQRATISSASAGRSPRTRSTRGSGSPGASSRLDTRRKRSSGRSRSRRSSHASATGPSSPTTSQRLGVASSEASGPAATGCQAWV